MEKIAPIIAISREVAAMGDEVAGELAKISIEGFSGWRIIGKNRLEDRMKGFGIDQASIEKFDEKRPSFFASFSQGRDDYFHFLKMAILDEAAEAAAAREASIFLGRGAAWVLNGVPGLISVFLTSPFDIRVARCKYYFHCEERKARQLLNENDNDKIGFFRTFFDADWRLPSNYHLVFNTGTLHPALCATSIMEVQKNIPESGKSLDELLFAGKLIHYIVYEKRIPVQFLDADVTKDEKGSYKTILYGVAGSEGLADAALTAAREMEGIGEITSEIKMVQEYNIVSSGIPQGGVMS
ncbi:MAG: cytidylate kinase-like family protein [Spirochaetaceae bacterium]|jgi:hypothetical protein|nr:cytidylate kinase-like family protein [Spirochaetaceae bacterium]